MCAYVSCQHLLFQLSESSLWGSLPPRLPPYPAEVTACFFASWLLCVTLFSCLCPASHAVNGAGRSHTPPVPLPCWGYYCPLVPGSQPSFSIWDGRRPSRAVHSKIPVGCWRTAAVSCIEWVSLRREESEGASKPVWILYSEQMIGLFIFRETQVAQPLLWRGLVHMKPNPSLSDTP